MEERGEKQTPAVAWQHVCLSLRDARRSREREREGERITHTLERVRERQTWGERERETEGLREAESERGRERERKKERERGRQREGGRGTERHREQVVRLYLPLLSEAQHEL